ncbi:MAG: acyl-CoA carboxylase subunit beta [Eubacteriales bacterium]|nr:acyl-CoA carboxylase subunit beta [Eubacteriales bacterium]
MQNKLDELINLKAHLREGGGEKAIAKQHNSGKMTARERIKLLFDKDSFVETGLFVKKRCTDFGMDKKESPSEGVITGYGQINGRLVYASSQDFTVIGGSLGEMHADKIAKNQEAALKVGAPHIAINDSGGARIQEGVDALAGYGKIFYNNTQASGVIPQISVIMGPCAGGAVYSPAITDFIFMVENTSQMFITGPQVIKTVIGEEISAEKLGGSITHNSISGVAHFSAKNEEECIIQIKKLLSYLPQNNLEESEEISNNDDYNRQCLKLNTILPENPNKAYDMIEIIKEIADDNDFFESQKNYAKNIITGFIRLSGKSIGIIANQPNCMAGCLDINASDKAARFIRTCDAFNIPILTLVDVPGFLPGSIQEHGGIIRHGAKMLFAYSESSVPMVTVIIRKAYGGAYIGMCSKHLGSDLVYAWPNAEIAVMGADGAANIIFAKEIKNSDNPIKTKEDKIKEYNDKMMNPYVAASRGYIDDIIEPSETRKLLINAFDTLATKRVHKQLKKHGNIPL